MAKRKFNLTHNKVQATENEGQQHQAPTFPKVAATAKIKSLTREIDLVKVKFKDLTFSPGQEPQLCEWMDNEDELIVTIEQYQGRL